MRQARRCREQNVNHLRAFGADDMALSFHATRHGLFSVWVTLIQHKWVISRERRRLATYCLVDGLAKVILTCLPEPSPQMSEQATANAKRRYERLNRAVAQAMRGEGAAVLKELGKYVGE